MQIAPSKCANHAPGTLLTVSHVQSGNAALSFPASLMSMEGISNWHDDSNCLMHAFREGQRPATAHWAWELAAGGRFPPKKTFSACLGLFSLPTTRTWFNRRCQTNARRPLWDVGAKLPAAQVSLVRDEGLKAGHDALPASAGYPEGGSYLSATRVGCGSSLGFWGHWEDNQGRGRSSFFVVQFLWDHPRWACGTRRGQFPPIEQTCFWVSTRIYARRHSHRVIVAQLR